MFIQRYKFDVIVGIRQLSTLIEKEIGKIINKFCMKKGIVRYHTNVSEPQRITGSMSRTLLETSRKLLFRVGIARKFLMDAISTVSYLVNRS